MGLLSKLFGRSDAQTINDTPTQTKRRPLAEDENFTIRPAQGQGYDKQAVTDETNRLMFELMLLDGAFESKQRGEPYMLPPHEQRAAIPIVAQGGLDMGDTDFYLSELERWISEARARL